MTKPEKAYNIDLCMVDTMLQLC